MYLIRKAAITGFFLMSGFLFICQIRADSLRSFDEIFPGLKDSQRKRAFSEEGFRRYFEKNESQSVIPAADSGIDLFSVVMEKKPSHFIEALMVVPYDDVPLEIMDVYNALGRIADIKNHAYFSHERNMNIHVFEESSRIESVRKNNPIPDPQPSGRLPASEEIYVHLKDRYFGSIYVRGNLSANRHGITYSLTNFKAIRFFVFTLMNVEKFSAILYAEPLAEGMLIYGMAAIDIPAFIASRINISMSIERRLTVFINWLNEGMKKRGC